MHQLFLYLIFFFLVICNPVFGQVLNDQFEHPRGLILEEDIADIRERITRKPYNRWYKAFKKAIEEVDEPNDNLYSYSSFVRRQSEMIVLEHNSTLAQHVYDLTVKILNDSLIKDNHYSFGLLRARVLLDLSIVYDFCYAYWSEKQRRRINDALLDLMKSVNSSMGFEANYSIESNWMGVRWGSVLFAACVLDDYGLRDETSNKPVTLPYLWDTKERLSAQLNANMTRNGWNVESLSYHGFEWMFVGPALIALNNVSKNERYFDDFSLSNFAPNALNAIYALSSVTVAIDRPNDKGIHPDFSDDDPAAGTWEFRIGMELYPENQWPAIKWMHDYLIDSSDGNSNEWFASIAYYKEDVREVNPEKYGWLNYHDQQQGVVVFRNDFNDEMDIVTAFTATQQRVKGHQGPDNLTFRLIGLDNIWAIGGGRSPFIAGQTNFFPAKPDPDQSTNYTTGKLLDHKFKRDGSGYLIGEGSCMGVKEHNRFLQADYSGESGAEAVLIIADKSLNGKVWRLNTPEWNSIELAEDGFIINAPDHSSLKATVFCPDASMKLDSGQLRYGGEAIRHNPGLCYKDACYEKSKYIDVICGPNVVVALTLQKAGKDHPEVKEFLGEGVVKVGGKGYLIRNWNKY